MDDTAKAEVSQFLNQLVKLSEEDFQVVRESILKVDPQTESNARKSAKLNAADFSWMDKAVRDAIRPLRGIFTNYGGLFSFSIAQSSSAMEAILRRDKLSAEQYEALVGGFRKVGVVIPEQGASQREGA
jgi:hypothetical protein